MSTKDFYHDLLARPDPDRILYLAIREVTYKEVFEEPIGSILLENNRIKLLIFDPEMEAITKWKP